MTAPTALANEGLYELTQRPLLTWQLTLKRDSDHTCPCPVPGRAVPAGRTDLPGVPALRRRVGRRRPGQAHLGIRSLGRDHGQEVSVLRNYSTLSNTSNDI